MRDGAARLELVGQQAVEDVRAEDVGHPGHLDRVGSVCSRCGDHQPLALCTSMSQVLVALAERVEELA
jgi:hypothetical protein